MMMAVPVSWQKGSRPAEATSAFFSIVIQDRRHLLQVLRAQEKVDVMKRLVRQQGQRLWIHDEHFLGAKLLHAHMVLGQQTVFGVILAEFEEFLVVKGGRGHGWWSQDIERDLPPGNGGNPDFARCGLRTGE
jgi:hypothetical protein